MLAKIGKAHRMVTADDELAFMRPQVMRSIDVLRDRGLSQMRAYEALGDMLGKSPSWVRGVVSRDPNIGFRLRDAFNIRTAYGRLCTRLEAAADADEAANTKLREELDAALSDAAAARPRASGRPALAEGSPSRGQAGRTPARALVRPAVGSRGAALGVNDLPLWRAIGGE